MPETDKPEIALKTSAAQEYDPNGLDGTALGEKQGLNNEFDLAAYDDMEQEMADDGRNSEQVENERAENNMTPPPEIAAQADREAHDELKAADNEAAQEINTQALEDYYEANKQEYDEMEQENSETGKDRGNDVNYTNEM